MPRGPCVAALRERARRRRWRGARRGSPPHRRSSPTCSAGGLLYVAPSCLHRREPDWREFSADHAFVENALAGMRVLRTGKAGSLAARANAGGRGNRSPVRRQQGDWESVTEYRVARHRRRLTDAEALRADVAAELRRIGWPTPETVLVQDIHRGPHGGLSGRVRLSFAGAQPGPLAIGRTSHKGGGLFANAV